MPEKIITLARLIIFPNTNYPDLKKYIISGVDTDFEYYMADTDTASMYKDFWNVKLSTDKKVSVIQGMLNCLELAYGPKFRVVRPHTTDELKQFKK